MGWGAGGWTYDQGTLHREEATLSAPYGRPETADVFCLLEVRVLQIVYATSSPEMLGQRKWPPHQILGILAQIGRTHQAYATTLSLC
jgi:hypothetical protein